MKKPLFALALIAFGIGIALYTNASFKEGNETMGATTPPPASVTPASVTPASVTPASVTPASVTPASAINSIMGNADIKKLLGSKEIQSLISGITSPSASAPNTVEPNVVSPPM